jgi:hypothetical protein
MTRQRFTATPMRTAHNFQTLMTTLKATSLKIEQDMMSGHAKVVFDRNGRRYIVEGTHFERADDNLRACYHTIRILYKVLAELGVVTNDQLLDETFDKIFGGFLATPDDVVLQLGDGRAPWWVVLGVQRDASREAIKNAYRALTAIHHPDKGGNNENFLVLRRAYDEAIKQVH